MDKFKNGREVTHSNLWAVGIDDTPNGLKVIKLSYPRGQSFSIQMNGSLNKLYYYLKGCKSSDFGKTIKSIPTSEWTEISKEIIEYVQNYGSAMQKSKLNVYETYKRRTEMKDKEVQSNLSKMLREYGFELIGNTYRKTVGEYRYEIDVTVNSATAILYKYKDNQKVNQYLIDSKTKLQGVLEKMKTQQMEKLESVIRKIIKENSDLPKDVDCQLAVEWYNAVNQVYVSSQSNRGKAAFAEAEKLRLEFHKWCFSDESEFEIVRKGNKANYRSKRNR